VAIDFPQEIGSLEERLALLEDPAFAEALARSNPLHYPGVALPPAPAARPKRYGSIALAITAAVSLVGSAVLVPLFAHRAPSQPTVRTTVVPAAAHAAAPHAAAAPKPMPVHLAPRAEQQTGPAASTAAVVTPLHAAAPAPAQPAHTVAAPAPVARHAAAPAVALHSAAAPHAAPSSDFAPAASHAAAAAQPSAEGASAGSSAGEPGAVTPRVSLADANEVLAASTPADGTKTPPGYPNGGMGPEHNPVTAVLDPCSPQAGRLGAIARQSGSLLH
jgi:hypothetical protein